MTGNSQNTSKPKKPRCPVCNKKLGLMEFKCKCDIRFCIHHANPESHECSFNYKKDERENLSKKLVKVVAEKVIPI